MPQAKTKHLTPSKDTVAELKERAIEYYRELPVYKLAAAKVGRDEDTMQRWKKEDSEFAYRLQVARADWILKNTKKTPPAWLLERLEKDLFAERKEITGKEGEPIQVESVTKLSDDELDRLLNEGARARKAQAGGTD